MKKLDYLSRSQIGTLHGLGGERNTLRVMESIAEYVNFFREGENVYYLSKAGRDRVGAEAVRTKIGTAQHYLMRNDLYISRRPEQFDTERRVIVGDITIVCDAIMKTATGPTMFVEIDAAQHMSKNKLKIEKYLKLKETGAFQEQHGYFPTLFWVTRLASRKVALTELCRECGLEAQVHLWESIR